MNLSGLIYIYGMSTMFSGMMTWFFIRKRDQLSRLVALLMFTICVECLRDAAVLLLDDMSFSTWSVWSLMTAIDMVAVPMYAFILIELVRPGWLTVRRMIVHEVPFVALPALYAATGINIFYYVLVGWAAIYGTYYLVWTYVNIPRYNRALKDRFSYTENVNLNWMRVILYTFYAILGLWIVDCLIIHLNAESIYMVGSLILWMVIDYFIYRHESVLDELQEESPAPAAVDVAKSTDLSSRIEALFTVEKIYLKPQLKLSDVARAVGTNRTYVSNWFNRDAGTTFYDYVNTLRVQHACELLVSSDVSVKCVAEMSGFNSSQAFIRVFSRVMGMSPTAYRAQRGRTF